MIRKKITELEARIRQSGRIDAERKGELLDLVDQIRAELEDLPEHKRVALNDAVNLDSSGEAREDITEAQAEKDLDSMRLAANDFSNAVLRFETSHPRLTDLANRLALMLSSVGI